jgi:two-component system chemotaxis sensor kinase CheA
MITGGSPMSDLNTNEPLLDMFLFETSQLLEQLEQTILASEKESDFTEDSINEIFRIMHTIKGSAAMMLFDNIAKLAHSIEDLFFYLRQEKPESVDCSTISDMVLGGVDFIKIEIEKIKSGSPSDGNSDEMVQSIKNYLDILKKGENLIEDNRKAAADAQEPEDREIQQYYISHIKSEDKDYKYSYKAVIRFEEGCEMENIRAYTILHNLKDITTEFHYIPEDIIDSDATIDIIRKDGFQIFLKADDTYEQMSEFFNKTIFLKDLELTQLSDDSEFRRFEKEEKEVEQVLTLKKPVKLPEIMEDGKDRKEVLHPEHDNMTSNSVQSIISVSVVKLDKLMDLVGEMVIAEAMVIQNPDLEGLQLGRFTKAARQLGKITGEIQDMVMSVRMVPLSATFTKMHRIVRDMNRKLNKEVSLNIIGEETEVDKNIIEHISDPLMHLVRNSVDHGIETPEERLKSGKSKTGTVTLEAKNAGSDVLILVKDDGKGLNKEKILAKAKEKNLLIKREEDMSEKEIFNLILQPGFSTNDKVTEFSGRGVGMDVVSKNIEAVGGSLSVDSTEGRGTVITMKIPLTLAIIDGMNIKVGNARYTLPTIAIKESFRPKEDDVFTDPDGNEMIMVRGSCYRVRRLYEMYQVKTEITEFTKGIILMIEQDENTICVFADELLGQQQVVVKALPQYIRNFKKTKKFAGCTLLGDGSISLIIDVSSLFIN